MLAFDKKSAMRKIIFIFIETIIASAIANSSKTVSIIKDITGYIGQIQVGLIGIVFTGYALFQALIGDKLMLYLLTAEKEQKSKLEESNESFIYLIVVQIIALLTDFFIYTFMTTVTGDWHLTKFNMLNVFMAVVGIESMFYLNIETIWELKSFIFNVYQLFNAHAMSRVVDIIENQKRDK